MRRDAILEAGLIAGVALAVLSFGGTEPISFAIVEALLLVTGLFLVATGHPRRDGSSFPVLIPALLLALGALQTVPLPESLLRFLGDHARVAPAQWFRPVSVAPHLTTQALLQLASYLAVFYLAIKIASSRTGRKHLMVALVALGSLEAVAGIAHFLTDWSPIRAFVSIPGVSPIGTYINRDDFAGLLEMTFPFALAMTLCGGAEAFGEKERPRRRQLFLESRFSAFLFWFLLSALLLLGIIGSLSRMGIFSALASAAFVALLLLSSRRHSRAVGALFFGLVAATLMATVWLGLDPLLNRYAEPMTGRLGIWRDTLAVVRSSPLVGSGLGTLGVAITPFQTVDLDKIIDHAHNDYLEFAVEWGIPAAALLVAAIFQVFIRVVRAFQSPTRNFSPPVALGAAGSLAAILLHSLTDFNLHIPANALVFAAVLGMAYAMSARPSTLPGTRRREEASP